MDCMLRVRTGDSSREDFLKEAAWSDACRSIKSKDHFNLLVSSKESFAEQLIDASSFLKGNLKVFDLLKASSGSAELDFGMELPDGICCANHRFPVQFLKLAADCGVELNVSLYAIDNE